MCVPNVSVPWAIPISHGKHGFTIRSSRHRRTCDVCNNISNAIPVNGKGIGITFVRDECSNAHVETPYYGVSTKFNPSSSVVYLHMPKRRHIMASLPNPFHHYPWCIYICQRDAILWRLYNVIHITSRMLFQTNVEEFPFSHPTYSLLHGGLNIGYDRIIQVDSSLFKHTSSFGFGGYQFLLDDDVQ